MARIDQKTLLGEEYRYPLVGLKDIDETIIYYFNNVIKPSAIKNSEKLQVPILYGSPERWAAVQKDGFYRDKNGKIQTPLIMFKRTSIEKNRALGNKLDANDPKNFIVAKKSFSKKNIYDKFSVLTNRIPTDEYFAVVIPDYVNITYECIIFTDYVEQMNKIVEAINYSSDSYWGDPSKFKFRAMIDNYTTVTELNSGEDRVVKTNFDINLLGYIITDTENTAKSRPKKLFSKSRLTFKLETTGDLETLVARASTAEVESPTRFFDQGAISSPSLPFEQIQFLNQTNVFKADIVSSNVATFLNKTFMTPPKDLFISQKDFDVYANGVFINLESRAVSVVGSNVEVSFNQSLLEYEIDENFDVFIAGKIEEV